MASFSVRVIVKAPSSTPTREVLSQYGRRVEIIKQWNFNAKLISLMANNNLPFAGEDDALTDQYLWTRTAWSCRHHLAVAFRLRQSSLNS